MKLLPDIVDYVQKAFPKVEQPTALSLLDAAVMHDGTEPGPRCLRCALVGSGGSLSKLESLVKDLRIDFRDVIVAGEYEIHEGKLLRVRDLNLPIAVLC